MNLWNHCLEHIGSAIIKKTEGQGEVGNVGVGLGLNKNGQPATLVCV